IEYLDQCHVSELLPNMVNAFGLLGYIHYQHKEYKEALNNLDIAIKGSKLDQLYLWRAEIYKKLNQFDAATTDYETILSMGAKSPFYSEAERHLKTLSDQKRFNEEEPKEKMVSELKKSQKKSKKGKKTTRADIEKPKLLTDPEHIKALQLINQILQDPDDSPSGKNYTALFRMIEQAKTTTIFLKKLDSIILSGKDLIQNHIQKHMGDKISIKNANFLILYLYKYNENWKEKIA